MKNSLFVLALFVTILSCQNAVDQHRASIEDLGTKWDSITNVVTGFSDMLNAENKNFTDMVSKMATDDGSFSTLSDDDKSKITAAKDNYTQAGAGLGEMVQSLQAFTTEWTTKAADVTALKEGLAAGKLEGDVATKIADLTTYLSEAGTKVSEWTGQLETMKNTIAASQSEYSSLVTQMASKGQ